jgi:hypothetical protein
MLPFKPKSRSNTGIKKGEIKSISNYHNTIEEGGSAEIDSFSPRPPLFDSNEL